MRAPMTVEELAAEIRRLTLLELAELNRRLRDEPGDWEVGVREPRRPLPNDPLSAEAILRVRTRRQRRA